MGKISNIMENGIAGLVSTLEFRQQPTEKSPHPASSETIEVEKKVNFWVCLRSRRENLRYFVISLLGTIIQFIIFKILYPFPDFISDSHSYISTNLYHMDVNLWPIGYSKFLLWVHMVSHSDTLLIGIQYFLLQASLAYFFFSICYLYHPAKKTANTIFIFLFFNPLFLYLSNAVLSDALFASLTIVFFTQFLWMYHRPAILQVIIQGVIIGLAFTIRYTAIYYPLITIVGLLISKHRAIVKLAGIALGVALMIPFYIYTCQKTKKITGTPEFSVFGGWQIANNALYMYGHINVDSNRLPQEVRKLDKWSKKYFKEFHPSFRELASLPGTYFIKVPYAILKPYMAYNYDYDTPPDQFKVWGQVSPIYAKYGTWLITHYPISFMRYYLLLNTTNYFIPHLEKFSVYNLQSNIVPAEVQEWFDYITPRINSVSLTFQGKLLCIYPLLFMILNIYFIGCLFMLVITRKLWHLDSEFRLGVLLLATYLTINFGFSVFATPVVLRYQVIPLVLLFSFSSLLIEFTDKKKVKPVRTSETFGHNPKIEAI